MKIPTLAKLFLVVFAGVLAALLVYSAPGWWRKHRAERETERETNYLLRVDSLTPAEVIGRCGRPKKDTQENVSDAISTRTLTYWSKFTQDNVQLNFNGVQTPAADGKKQIDWSFSDFFGDPYEHGTLTWEDNLHQVPPCAFPALP